MPPVLQKYSLKSDGQGLKCHLGNNKDIAGVQCEPLWMGLCE
jgi:hypothetical protein